MITFRRRVSNRLMLSWLDLVSIAESISFSEDCDSICWAFDGSSKFSVQSMYKTITFRGILPVHTPAVWQLSVPPRIHIFLWLLSNNKILTRINLAKRRHVEDLRCLFCNEPKTTHHLFFECIVANIMWKHLSDIFNIALGSIYESIARWWLSNNNHCVLNMSCAALMWCLWKLRNDICFQAKKWRDERVLLHKILETLRNWQVLCKEEHLPGLMHALGVLEFKLRQPLQLLGSQEPASSNLVLSAGRVSSPATTESISEDLALHLLNVEPFVANLSCGRA